jgi:hypothetical protein
MYTFNINVGRETLNIKFYSKEKENGRFDVLANKELILSLIGDRQGIKVSQNKGKLDEQKIKEIIAEIDEFFIG